MQTRLVKFAKVYLVFMLSAILVNVAMEIAIPTPEKAMIIAEHGWDHYMAVNVRGIILFYAIFSLVGGVIYISTNLRSVEMGASSLVIGFVLEFAFMRPGWVLRILALRVAPADVVAVIVSVFYWYVAWGLPSYLIQRYLMGLGGS